ncbi:MAG: hypothetical protein IJN25_04355 [Clostridia bacterium]|nr:hypothetical protein [Clostridia bacterium]
MIQNKKILSLALVLSMIAACLAGTALVATAQLTKSLENGTFTQEADGSIPGWNDEAKAYLVTSTEAAESEDLLPNYAGNYLKIAQGADVCSNYFDVKKGAPYRISGYYKTSGTNTAAVGAVHYEMESGEAVHEADYLSDSLAGTENVWTYFEHSFKIPADSTVADDAVCLRLIGDADASESHVWFAKLAVKENLFKNGGFELSNTNETIGATFAQNWKIKLDGADNSSVTYQTTGGKDNSAYVTVNSPKISDNEKYYPYIYQGGLPFKSGRVYTLSFDYMTTVKSNSAPFLRINLVDTSKKNYIIEFQYRKVTVKEQISTETSYVTAQNDSNAFLGYNLAENTWHSKSISFVCPEGEWDTSESSIQLRENVSCTGISCFDNLCLVEEDEESAFAYYNEDGVAISTLQNGESATAKLHYMGSNTQDSETVIAFTGIYTKDNKLISVTPITKQTVRNKLSLTNSKTGATPVKPCIFLTKMDFETEFTTPDEGEFIVRSFVWNDLSDDTITPILDSIHISNITTK